MKPSSLPLHTWLVSRTCLIACSLAALANGQAQTLGQALDNTNLTWTTSGSGGGSVWYVTSTMPHDGPNDVTSGNLPTLSSATSTLQTTLVGPGTLSFWWRNDALFCYLSFIAGTNTVGTLSDSPSWRPTTYYLGPGTQTFKWFFWRYYSSPDSGAAYLDGVNFTPGVTAPVITAQPVSQSQVPGLDATFTVAAGGTPPLSYQWRFNGTNIPGATSNSYTVLAIRSTDLGNYAVVVSNAVDSIVSSNASLEFGRLTAWGLTGDWNGWNATTIPPDASNILAACTGPYRDLALRRNGAAMAWGFNNYGQGVVPPELADSIALATGNSHNLVLRPDGTVIGWGYNGDHETDTPAGLSNVVAIAAGDFHSLALRADGTVIAWGQNSAGQTNVPGTLTNVVAIAGGGALSLALTADGHVVEWSGQSAPVDVSNVVAIAAGGGHYLALREDGTLAAWGQNKYGEATVPPGLSNVVGISAGSFHSLALLANGTVAAWGYQVATNVPSNLTNVVAISAGHFHSLALVGDGPPVIKVKITDANWSTNGFQLSIPSQCGRVYALQYKESLADSNWIPLPLVAGTGTNLVLRDSTAIGPRRLYRVLRW